MKPLLIVTFGAGLIAGCAQPPPSTPAAAAAAQPSAPPDRLTRSEQSIVDVSVTTAFASNLYVCHAATLAEARQVIAQARKTGHDEGLNAAEVDWGVHNGFDMAKKNVDCDKVHRIAAGMREHVGLPRTMPATAPAKAPHPTAKPTPPAVHPAAPSQTDLMDI